MKICMLVPNEFAPDPRAMKEAEALKDNGLDVEILAIGLSWSSRHEESEDVNGVKVRRVGGIKCADRRLLRAILMPYYLTHLFFKAFKSKADTYHCHDLYALFVGVFLKIFTRKRLVYDAHEYYPLLISENPLFPRLTKPLIRSLVDLFERFCCFFADYVITVDQFLEDKYRKIGKRIEVVSNFPEASFFKEVYDAELRDRYSKYDIIVYAGGLSYSTGIIESIKAVDIARKKKPRIRLLLIGSFLDAALKEESAKFIKSHGIEDNVEFIGQIPHPDVSKYFSISKMGLMLYQPIDMYLQVQYPIKLFEYMSMANPVVASNFPNIRKILEDNDCGVLVDPTNAEDISNAIIHLLDNTDDAKRMGENGRKAVGEKYNWNLMEKRLLEVYSNLSKQD